MLLCFNALKFLAIKKTGIIYSYSKVDSNYKLIGSPIIKYVDGETVKQVNDAFHFIGYNHDLSKYTPTRFWKVEEIKEH